MMMNPCLTRFLVGLLLAGWLLPGCVRLGQRAPEKSSYVFSAERLATAPKAISPGVLQISPLRISPRFASRSFVYRHGTTRYQPDFYHVFLVSPASLVQEEVVRWLAASGIFSVVSTSAGPLPPDFLLQGHISELYGDFRAGQSAAILEITFILLDHRSDKNILLNRGYRSQIPLANATPEALIIAWNAALAHILSDLEEDLGTVVTLLAEPGKEPSLP
jgi:ABC-type uncharacterized transport system auxiliary subunit